MADCSPTTIDGSPKETAVACSRCERAFAPVNLAPCSACSAALCADCLGPDPLGWCRDCLEVAALRPEPFRRSVMIITTGYVPRALRMRHVRIARIGRHHAEVVAEATTVRLIVPIGVLAGAGDQIAALRAGKAVQG